MDSTMPYLSQGTYTLRSPDFLVGFVRGEPRERDDRRLLFLRRIYGVQDVRRPSRAADRDKEVSFVNQPAQRP